jgi:hypothetical protein
VRFSELFGGLPLATETQEGSPPRILIGWVFVAIVLLSGLVIAVERGAWHKNRSEDGSPAIR